MKKRILLLFIGIVSSYTLAIAQSKDSFVSVDFKIKNLGINVDGRFNTASITTNFESEDHKDWYLEGYVEVNTIDTDNKARDKHLLEPDYFDAKKHPKITIVSKSFKKISGNSYNVTVEINIKGTKKIMKIPVEITGANDSFVLKSNFEINRRDFNVGGGSLILSSKVKINVNYKLNR